MKFSSPFFLLPFLSLLHYTGAAADTLYASSVSYCSATTAVEIDQFAITYFKANQSVYFTFNLASVESIPSSYINLNLNIYGMNSVNETVDLCTLIYGVLCPLPQVNFTGGGTYQLPDSVTSGIPSLAWTVPNIEAYARLELISNTTGEVAACLQATLSNGLTVQHNYVVLISSLFTLVALLIGLFHSGITTSPSPAQYRWFDILFLFQTAASTGMLNLNYPLVYSEFVKNFAWAFGLIYSGSIESSISKMRARTGGNLNDTNTIQYIDTELSPYNMAALVDLNTAIATPSSFNTFISSISKRSSSIYDLSSRALSIELDTNSQTNTTYGIAEYTTNLGIPRVNAYDTIFFIFLAFIAVALAFHAVLFLFVWAFDRVGRGGKGSGWAGRLRMMYWNFCMGNALRVCLIGFLPIWTFAFYQFTIGTSDSGLSIFFAVFGILLTFLPLAIVFILSLFKHRKQSSTAPDISPLYTSWRWFHSAGAIYRPYRSTFHFTWFAPLVLAMIARAGFIAFGSSRPYAQVIGCMAVEFIVLVYLIITRPHKDKKGDWLGVFLSFLRLASFGLLIAFITEIGVGAITRAIIGFVLIALFGIPTVLLFFGMIWNAGYGYLWRRHKRRIEDGLEVEDTYTGSDDDSQRPAMAERGLNGAGIDSHRASTVIPPGDGSAPTLARRTSIMEPVGEGVYDQHNYHSSSRNSAIFPNQSGNSSEEAYAAASRGSYIDQTAQHGQYNNNNNNNNTSSHRKSVPLDTPVMSRNNTASSRPTSGYSEYYTPAGMATGQTGDEGRFSGQQYFDAR